MIVNVEQAQEYIGMCLKNKLVPMLAGSPGGGKSSIIQEIANKFKLKLIDERLSTYDSTDIHGFPRIKEDKAEFVPFDTFPLEGRDEIPDGYHGWLIFLDEFNSASMAVQVAAYRFVLDRQLGNRNVHERALIVCAGNLSTDGAIVNRLSTAMQSRLIHLELEVTPEEWLKWANKNDIDHRVMAYINHVPDNLHVFDPRHNDKTFACNRTWEFASKLITGIPTSELGKLIPLLAGTIGEGVAHEFVTYTAIYSQIPTFQDILKDPTGTKIGKEPAMMFAVSHMIAAYVSKTNIDKAMEYVNRIPIEFQTITLQGIVAKDSSMIREKVINKWIYKNGADLF